MTGRKRARTYRFDVKLIARVDAAAKELGVNPGPLLELLIERGLTEVESGRWPLGRRAVAYRPKWNDE